MKKTVKVSVVIGSLLGVGLIAYGLQTKSVPDTQRAQSATISSQPELIEKITRKAPSSENKPPKSENDGTEQQKPSVKEREEEQISAEVAAPGVERDPEKALQDFVQSGDPEGIRRVYAERRKERAKLVKAKMDNEQVDMEWSADLSSRFEFARNLVPELANLKLTQVDCRNTICAIHIAYADANYEQYSPFLQQVGIVLGADAWVHHDALPGEGVVYVARENKELPKLKQL